MRIEQASITTEELSEATIFIPGKIGVMNKQLGEMEKRLEELKRKALWAGRDIVDGKTTGEPFWDIALVLACEWGQDLYSKGAINSKTLDAAKAMHNRLEELDRKLKENPNELLLFDRTTFTNSSFRNSRVASRVDLGIGRINDDPSIAFEVKNKGYSPAWFWHDTSNSISVELQGYKHIASTNNNPPVPEWNISWIDHTGLDETALEWASTPITGFFKLYRDYRWNGLARELGEPDKYPEHLGGIIIKREKIIEHLQGLADRLDRTATDDEERSRNQGAVQPILEFLSS